TCALPICCDSAAQPLREEALMRETTGTAPGTTDIPATRPGGGPQRRRGPVIVPPGDIELEARNLSVLYGETRALKHISISIPDRRVVAVRGPSRCGKGPALRCIARMD